MEPIPRKVDCAHGRRWSRRARLAVMTVAVHPVSQMAITRSEVCSLGFLAVTYEKMLLVFCWKVMLNRAFDSMADAV